MVIDSMLYAEVYNYLRLFIKGFSTVRVSGDFRIIVRPAEYNPVDK